MFLPSSMLRVCATRSIPATCSQGLATKTIISRVGSLVSIEFVALSQVGVMPTDTRAATATAKVNRRGRTEAASPSFESYLIKNTNINEAPGVELSLRQKLIVGSVLDVR